MDVSADRVRVIKALRTADNTKLTSIATTFGILTSDDMDVYEDSIANAILDVLAR